ncbi:MAG: hypothetical protein ACJ72A_24795 [Nocardioidaceae bacterium]
MSASLLVVANVAQGPRGGGGNGTAVVRLSRLLERDVLVNLPRPRFVLVRQPDLLRVERVDQPLAFGARLAELGEEDRHVAPDDN